MPEHVGEITETVSITNLKTLGEGTSFFTNLAHGNAVSHQQAMNTIAAAATSKAVEMILGTSPVEGGGDIAALMQLVKAAQTTPPVTP